ncbi:membrane protein [Bacillus ectoiniformans]|uniref:YihY/virulence factor BrkB family protein n=1 Tax=Bacillus ectoiniformans TaxID=1494429 RepID=UPI00195A09CB|nr:YihY/virulence factor BrkB family protein [Bacillus ectoiniformans]MBM7649277.1 membrane protein [Bacillus ectoiniformans]
MRVLTIIKKVLGRFFAERFYDQAAQTAYYLLLSIMPFFIFVLSLISYFPLHEEDVLVFIEPYAPAETYSLIHENVQEVLEKGKGQVLSVSLISAFWLSSMAIQSLVRSLNDAYGIKRSLPFFKGLLRDLLVTMIFMFLVPLSLIIPLVERFLAEVFSSDVRSFWEIAAPVLSDWPIAKWMLGTLFLLGFFILFYQILPHKRSRILSVLPGAMFATVCWQGVSILFSEYTGVVSYTRIYGQLAGIIILMLWFYLTAVVLLVGGLMNAENIQRE